MKKHELEFVLSAAEKMVPGAMELAAKEIKKLSTTSLRSRGRIPSEHRKVSGQRSRRSGRHAS